MTTLRINITKEVLQATKMCKAPISRSCAISHAIRDIWPKAQVQYDGIYPNGDDNEFTIYHDQNHFIVEFDNATPAERAAMQPFSFEIEVPDEVIGEVNIEEIRKICEGSKTLELV